MEVYILNDLLQRDTVIDRFESCIWTERFSGFGEFQLVMHSTTESKSLLKKGLKLTTNLSKRVMTIENVEDKDDSEGRSLLTVSGRSLEAMFNDRGTRSGNILTGGLVTESWESTGTPAFIVRDLVDRICVSNTNIVSDRIPFLTTITDSLYPANTIPEPDQVITAVIENGQLYDIVKSICDAYGLGFRLYRGPDNQRLYFDVYSGNDRTSSQTTLPAVIFSPDLENLVNTSELSSIENEKNIAYVFGANKTHVVYAAGADTGTSGFNRKVIMVEARDIAGTDAAATTLLEQRGKEELSKYKPLEALDGELPVTTRYIYDVDYSIGDLVELRNDEGTISRKRITEQIFVDDAQGERSYPTLTSDLFITEGSWAAWDASAVWDAAVGVWATASGDDLGPNIVVNGSIQTGTTAGWGVWPNTTISASNAAGEFRTGYGLKVVTTAPYGGAGGHVDENILDSSTGEHAGSIWVKAPVGAVLTVTLDEYALSPIVLVGQTPPITVVGTGDFVEVSASYIKTQSDTKLRFSVQKETAGTFYLDDATIQRIN